MNINTGRDFSGTCQLNDISLNIGDKFEKGKFLPG
jgi:hypothetical protein